MSTPVIQGQVEAGPSSPRVRHQAREAVTLMAFSAVTSLCLATALLVLTHLGQLG